MTDEQPASKSLNDFFDALEKESVTRTSIGEVEYPIEITGVKLPRLGDKTNPHSRTHVGDFVAVRPCAERFEGKTYLGIYIGVFPIDSTAWMKQDGTLEVFAVGSSLIHIPSLAENVWGCGSWWKKIESEEALKQITDEMIDNIWYVKALRLQLVEEKDK